MRFFRNQPISQNPNFAPKGGLGATTGSRKSQSNFQLSILVSFPTSQFSLFYFNKTGKHQNNAPPNPPNSAVKKTA